MLVTGFVQLSRVGHEGCHDRSEVVRFRGDAYVVDVVVARTRKKDAKKAEVRWKSLIVGAAGLCPPTGVVYDTDVSHRTKVVAIGRVIDKISRVGQG